MKDFLLSLDYFSPKPTLYFKSKKGYHTIFGTFITLIAFIAIFGFILYFLVFYYQGQEYYIASSKANIFEKSIDLSDSVFLYRLIFSNKSYVPKSIVQVIPTVFSSRAENVSITFLNVSYCSRQKHYPDKEYDDLLNFEMSTYDCFDKGQDLTIINKKSPENLNQFFNFYVIKCNNNTSKETCKTDEEINQILTDNSIFFDIGTETSGVDHQNKHNPISKIFQSYQILIPQNFFYLTYFFFRKLVYTSDDGILFQNLHTYQSFQFDVKDAVSVAYPKEQAPSTIPGTLMVMQFNLNDDFAEKYTRNFSKFQTLLANVGGICNFIMTIARFIELIGTKPLMFRDIYIESQRNESSYESTIKLNQSKKNNPMLEISTASKNKFLNISTKNNLSKLEESLKKDLKKEKIIYKNISMFESAVFQICFLRKWKTSKFKFLRECEINVKKKLSCEEIIASNEVIYYLFNQKKKTEECSGFFQLFDGNFGQQKDINKDNKEPFVIKSAS